MTDKKDFIKKHVSKWMIDDGNNTLLWKNKAPTVNEVLDFLAEAVAEEKQLSYNEGVEDARLAVCSVEKNTWEKYVYLRIDKIFELLKKLTKKE